ncbi:MAG: hypothetical protein SFX72_04230 [Isosphaeraceae bacterium]|nr:hypothetical protein [Isosphaeraceae bacterium]
MKDDPKSDPHKSVVPESAAHCAAERPACPVCGGPLVEIRAKLLCARCRTICETCCEGGRG